MFKRQFFAGALVAGMSLLNLSCSSPDENELPPAPPAMTQPVVTGIVLTNEQGPEPVGEWGRPSEGMVLDRDIASVADMLAQVKENASAHCTVEGVVPFPAPTEMLLTHPYPNPSRQAMIFRFAMPSTATVDFWIVPARWYQLKNEETAAIASGGAVTAIPPHAEAYILLSGRQLPPGYYTITLSKSGFELPTIPAGFYRAFLKINNSFYWRDIYLYDDDADLPSGMRLLHYPTIDYH